MELILALNNDCVILAGELRSHAREYFPLLNITYYNENIYKEKQKSYKLKGGFGARQVPFAVLYDNEKKPVKAFYNEDNSCTFDNIIKCLTNFVAYGQKEDI